MGKIIFLAFLIFIKSASSTLLDSVCAAGGPLTAPGTSAGITSSGGTLLIIVVGNFGVDSTTNTVTDSRGNTWHSLTLGYNANGGHTVTDTTIWYAWDHGGTALSTGSGHTATVTGNYVGFCFAAYNGTLTGSDPLDQQNGNGAQTTNTLQINSITPTVNGTLIIAGMATTNILTPYTINSPFTTENAITFVGGVSIGVGLGSYSQTTAAAVSPTWSTGGGSNDIAVSIASFKPAAPSVTKHRIIQAMDVSNSNIITSGTTDLLGVTNTQALLSYVAPSTAPCSWEISESPTYSPVINDINTSLFILSNLDSRSPNGNVGSVNRIFIVGSRIPTLALDSKIYSRSLQAYTIHYYRRTCGTQISTGNFTTSNIPVGNTFNEMPLPDPVTPGGWLLPTITTNVRNLKINDPYTGALLSPVSIFSDQIGGGSGSTGIDLNDGARVHNTNPATHTVDGNECYLSNLNQRVGWHNLYLICPFTGESRHLGLINLPPNSDVDDALKVYEYATPNTIAYTYTGNYAALPGGFAGGGGFNQIALDGGTSYLTKSIETLMHDYEPSFEVDKYGCTAVHAVPGKKEITACQRAGQDSYGWMGVFDGTTKTIIAAWNSFIQGPTKYCGIHEYFKPVAHDVIEMDWHGLGTNNYPGIITSVGQASIVTTTTASSAIGTNTITVAGAVASMASGGDSVAAPAVAIGDVLNVSGNRRSISNIAGNVWTLNSNLTSTVNSGDQVQMACNVPFGTGGTAWQPTYWFYLDDPHGTDTTNINVVLDSYFPGGGHRDTGPLSRVSEGTTGWEFVPIGAGTFKASLNQPTNVVDSTASYNGVSPSGSGNRLVKHPSYQQTDNSPWFTDRVIFSGGDPSTGSPYTSSVATVVSGSLYKYFSTGLNRKLIPTQATSGSKSLRDISSAATGDIIGTGAGDNYKYCVAYKVNECRSGSAVGDIYFNVPSLTYGYCIGGDAPNPTNIDTCITDMPTYSGALMQIYQGTNNADSQSKSRNITGGLVGPKNAYVYPQAKALPDGSYILFTVGIVIGGEGQIDVWKAKLPPLPTPDSYDRTKYIPTTVNIPASGQDNALIKFWYETGFCGSRLESCYAKTTNIPAGVNPYSYPSDGASSTLATLSGLSCGSGCNIDIPFISKHVGFYQIILRDSSNNILSTGDTKVITIP